MARRSKSPLGSFEGLDVVSTKIAITNAGDGLSKAMQIEPQQLHLGDTVYVVLEATVGKISYAGVKDTDVLERVQVLKAGVATIVEEALVKDVLDAQRIAIERAAGVERLDFGDPGEGDGEQA